MSRKRAKREKLNLKPGNYYFFGLDSEASDKEKEEFDAFLEVLPVPILQVFHWGTGSNSNNSTGLYYITPDMDRIRWCSRTFTPKDFDRIISDPQYQFLDRNKVMKNQSGALTQSIDFRIYPGQTSCSETCAFYWFCDHKRNSLFNPAKAVLGLSCSDYDFSTKRIMLV